MKLVRINLVSLMESLDSTLETKRPAAALNLLSQQKKPQVAISSEGQCQTSNSVFTLTNYFPGSVADWLGLRTGSRAFKSRSDH